MLGFFEKDRFESVLSPEQLPGVKKKSFYLPYNGGEIWFEHLDGMFQYTELVREKLKLDSKQFLKLSGTSFLAVVLFDTTITDEIIEDLVSYICKSKKRFRRVCFIGASGRTKRRIIYEMDPNLPFQYCFLNDTEKAKEWLLPQ
ncbi:MAG: hypothetical protein ACI4KF_00755 [Huintestinicola sp.]